MGTFVRELPAGVRLDDQLSNGFFVGRRPTSFRSFCSQEAKEEPQTAAIGSCEQTASVDRVYIDDKTGSFYIPAGEKGYYQVGPEDGVKDQYTFGDRWGMIGTGDTHSMQKGLVSYLFRGAEGFDYSQGISHDYPRLARWDLMYTALDRFQKDPAFQVNGQAIADAVDLALNDFRVDIKNLGLYPLVEAAVYHLIGRSDLPLTPRLELVEQCNPSNPSNWDAHSDWGWLEGALYLAADQNLSVDEQMKVLGEVLHNRMFNEEEKGVLADRSLEIMDDPEASFDNAYSLLDELNGHGEISGEFYAEKLVEWARDTSRPAKFRCGAAAAVLSRNVADSKQRSEMAMILAGLINNPDIKPKDRMGFAETLTAQESPEYRAVGWDVLQKMSEDPKWELDAFYRNQLASRLCLSAKDSLIAERGAMVLLANSRDPEVEASYRFGSARLAAECADQSEIPFIYEEANRALLDVSRDPEVDVGRRLSALSSIFRGSEAQQVKGVNLADVRATVSTLSKEVDADDGRDLVYLRRKLTRLEEAGAEEPTPTSNLYVRWSQE